jgi:hypothetical protein
MALLQQNLQDLYLDTALPWIEYIIEEEYEMYPKISQMLFNIRDMKYGIAQHAQVSSLTAAAQVGEGEELPQDRVYQGFSTTFKSKKYGILLATSQEVIDHEKYDSLSKNPKKMGRAVATTCEIVASSVFNNAFTAAGSDGQPLCSQSHPLLSPGAQTIDGSGLGKNLLAVAEDLSATALKDTLTLMRQTVDSSGNNIMLQPKRLVVPPALEFIAWEILHSAYLPDTPNNNLSSVGPESNYRIDPVVWNYLTDPTAFFLMTDNVEHDLYFFWDKQPEVKSQMEFKTDVALSRILTRFTVGYSDWRGIVGTPGV